MALVRTCFGDGDGSTNSHSLHLIVLLSTDGLSSPFLPFLHPIVKLSSRMKMTLHNMASCIMEVKGHLHKS